MKITFENYSFRTKAKWQSINKLDENKKEFVKQLLEEEDYSYISENKHTFKISSIYINIDESDEDYDFDFDYGYVVRISDHWNSVGQCEWETDKEETLIIEIEGKKMEVRFCNLIEFELVEWEYERQCYNDIFVI